MSKSNSLVTSKEVEIIQGFVRGFNKADVTSKELFVQAFKLFKQNSDKSQQIKVNFTSALKTASLGNEAIMARGKKIIKLAETYTELKAVSKFSDLHFYNLETIVKVLSFIKENHPLSYSLVRNRVAGVYDAELSKIEYNNSMRDELTAIKQEFNLVDQEGEIVSLDGKLKGILMSLSDEDKAEVITMLGGTVVADEVEAA